MQGAHLRIVCKLVRIGIAFEKKELNDRYGTVFDGQVQERLAHRLKAVLDLAGRALRFEHLVHFNELIRLIVLDELY